MPFGKIVGNEKIKKILIETIESNNILHSYMFIGKDGIGKKIMAEEFAKMILCQSNANKPCEICKSCIEFNNNNNPDYIKIEPDGNSIKIEQIRNIQNKIIEKPIISNKKVYIIDDSEKMTTEAQNCLLKTLEEPPEFIVIILITSNENLMLNTIKSRCTKINFDKLTNDEIIQILKEKFESSKYAQNIINASEGSMGKVLHFQEKKELYDTIDDIFKNISNMDIIDLVNKSRIIYQSKNDIFDILNYINTILYQNMKQDYLNNKKYINSMETVEKTKNRLNSNGNYDMSIDFLVFKIWEELNK